MLIAKIKLTKHIVDALMQSYEVFDNDGTGDEPTFFRRRPNDSEFLDLDAKIDKSGIGEDKTLNSNEPTILDLKEFNYDNFSLIDCISLL